jgi:hypothetical protein
MTTLIPKFEQTGSTVNRPINLKLEEIVSVKDFGAVGNGSTDDTAAIQAAINSLSATGGTVYLPTGTYKVSSTISWTFDNLTLMGAGKGATEIRTFIAATDVIGIGTTADGVSRGGIYDLSIIADTTQVSGAGIHLTNCNNVRISNVVMGYGLYTGIQISAGADQFGNYIDNFFISTCTYGIYVGGATGIVQGVYASDGVIGSCTNSGILLQQISGFYGSSFDIISCRNALSTFPNTGQSVANCFFSDITCDTSTESGWAFLSNGGKVEQVNMVNCWGASCADDGLFISQQCNAFVVTNFRAINNQQRGIYVQGGKNLNFVNCQVLANSMVGSASFDGFSIDGATVDNLSIIGGKFGSGWDFAGYNFQRYGIFISGGDINNYSIIGVDTTGNVTGGILDSGTGAVKYIYGNPGYVTSASGNATITAATSVNVTHGLAVTPTNANILVTPTSSLSTETFWVDNIGATTFRINTTGAVTATFAWQARVSGA